MLCDYHIYIYICIYIYIYIYKLIAIAEMRTIGGYENMSSSINQSKLVKEPNFNNARIGKFKKDFNELRNRFSKTKIKEIKRDLHRIENRKIGETEKTFLN